MNTARTAVALAERHGVELPIAREVAAILFSGYSLVLCLLWQYRGAPDVAMTEAAVGAGVTTVLVLLAVSRTSRREK